MKNEEDVAEIEEFIKDMKKIDIYLAFVEEREARVGLGRALALSGRENARLRQQNKELKEK